jgi:hypothetical protein
MPTAFESYLTAEVDRVSAREKISTDKAFLFWFGKTILELSDDSTREAISVEGANDKGIDLFIIDDDEGRIIIGQGKYSSNLCYKPKIKEITTLESSLNWLCSPEALARDGKLELAQAAQDYLDAQKKGYGVELWFVYAGLKCPNVEKHISVYNQNPENIERRRVLRHCHLDLLESTWQELEGVTRRIDHGSISALSGPVHKVGGDFGEACVISVPAREIVRLYKKHEDRLFDRNVRLFLGVRKGSVNAGIAETLRDNNDCKNFWAYNNGLTIICDTFIKKGTKVKLTNFSIVNGCQTAVSLAQGPESNLANVVVLVRLIAASSGIVDDIIRYTNSQNPIRTWDIASQDRTQRRLATEFMSLAKPFIYVTRRGARPKGDLERFKEGGKLRQIRIDVLGQYAAAFRGYPVLAYRNKAEVFSNFRDDVFPPDIRVEEVLFQWLCGEKARDVVQERVKDATDTEVRVLKKGGTLFTLAVMADIMLLRNGAAYLSNCSESILTSKGTGGRIQKYAEYARDKYIQAVIDQGELDGAELHTLVRNPDFYGKVRDRIKRNYQKDALATLWLKEALPPLVLR